MADDLADTSAQGGLVIFSKRSLPGSTRAHDALRNIRTRAFALTFALIPCASALAQTDPNATGATSSPPPAGQPIDKPAVAVEISDPAPSPGRSPLPDTAPQTGITGEEEKAREAERLRAAEPQPETWADTQLKLSVGGGLILYYYQPLQDPPTGKVKNNFEVFEARVRVDAEFGRFGLHLMPVIRDTKERGFFPSTAWVQEAYAYAKVGPVTIKAGKVWTQFGRFWDNSFYGNAQEYDGFKLNPEHGISAEGDVAFNDRAGLVFFGQYFIIDGTTNYSLPGRDTMGAGDGARRRNHLIGRVEPYLKIGSMTTLKLGLSGAFFQADLPMLGKQPVARVAVDATVMVDGFTAWAEYTYQGGNHLAASPFTGTDPTVPHDRADYALIGAEYTYDRYTVRYNFNMGDYKPINYREWRSIPGIGVALDKRLFVLLEWVWAKRKNGDTKSLLDHCLAFTIHGKV